MPDPTRIRRNGQPAGRMPYGVAEWRRVPPGLGATGVSRRISRQSDPALNPSHTHLIVCVLLAV